MPKPMQPIIMDKHGVARFKANQLVLYLLDHGGIDMNHLAVQKFTDEDRDQFAQLIGYSVSGWGDLNYVSRTKCQKADRIVRRKFPRD